MKDDEFFREVQEDYRRDQMARIWKRYGTLIVAVAILLVAAVGGWRYWQYREVARAQEAGARFEEAIRLARDGKAEESEKILAELEKDAPRGYRLLSRFRLAAEAGKADPAAGAKAYDELAADASLDGVLRDLARLRAAMLRLDRPDAAGPARASLQALAVPTNPWRHTARELLGLEALKAGDHEGAGRWFEQIAGDREAPPSLRQRLEIYAALAAGGPVQVTQ